MAGNVNINFNIKKLPEKPWFWGVVLFIILLIFGKVATAFAVLFLIFLFILIFPTINAYSDNSDSRHGFFGRYSCLSFSCSCLRSFRTARMAQRNPRNKTSANATITSHRTNSPVVIKPNIIKLDVSINSPPHVF